MAAAGGLAAFSTFISAASAIQQGIQSRQDSRSTRTPGRSDAEVQEAARRERLRRATARGRRSTILGGSVGPPGVAQQQTLLGGDT